MRSYQTLESTEITAEIVIFVVFVVFTVKKLLLIAKF